MLFEESVPLSCQSACAELFIVFPYYFFDVWRVCSDGYYLIPDIVNLCLLFLLSQPCNQVYAHTQPSIFYVPSDQD